MRVEERRFVGVLREMKEGTEREGSGTLHEEEKKMGRKQKELPGEEILPLQLDC